MSNIPPDDQLAEVICDTISPKGERVTTWVINLWKVLLAELNTHRSLSRNAASSRAVPLAKFRLRCHENPFVPFYWGSNKPGMQAGQELDETHQRAAKEVWESAMRSMFHYHAELEQLGVHKQVANRLLEPWMTAQVVITGTELKGFKDMRDTIKWAINGDSKEPIIEGGAQPEFAAVAGAMMRTQECSTPVERESHLPFIRPEDISNVSIVSANDENIYNLLKKMPLNAMCSYLHLRMSGPPVSDSEYIALLTTQYIREQLILTLISAARCARVSYFLPDGSQYKIEKDFDLCTKLLSGHHMSPFEHPCYALPGRHGNFVGWKQFRKFLPRESFGDYS